MNSLSSDDITLIYSKLCPGKILHATSVAYIQYLLTGIVDALGGAENFEEIKLKIQAVFPGDLARIGTLKFIEAVCNSNSLDNAKRVLLEYLASEILDLRDTDYLIILPWEIQKSIGKDTELSQLLGINSTDTTLHVSFIMSPHLFASCLNEEFTMGLLLFLKNLNHHVKINIFGAFLTTDYFSFKETKDLPLKYVVGDVLNDVYPFKYKVTVGDRDYTFSSIDFMHGFSTGAMCLNLDHHDYWSNLMIESEDGEWTKYDGNFDEKKNTKCEELSEDTECEELSEDTECEELSEDTDN
jgi:hypothetical protein